MKRISFSLFSLLLISLLGACNKIAPTQQEILHSLSLTPKLYSAECVVSKLVLVNDEKLWGIGDRKAIIPVKSTLKAGIDLSKINSKMIELNESNHTIKIFLPDPEIEMESATVDFDNVVTSVTKFRDSFGNSELTAYTQQGCDSIVKEIPNLQLIGTAQLNAKEIVFAMLIKIGYKPSEITIEFKDDRKFSSADIEKLIKVKL